MDCYAKGYCKLYNTAKCTNMCDFKVVLDALYSLSNIPKRYRQDTPLRPEQIDLQSFHYLKDYKDNIDTKVEQGHWLYLFSKNSGNGKTSWALRLVQAYLASTWLTSPLECKVLYINLPTFFNAFKETFTANPGKDAVDYVQHILNNYKKCDIIIWDDVATKQFSKFEGDELLGLLDGRAKKCNIFTSNLKDSELHQAIGDRLYSRIANASINIELYGSDKRGLY